MALRLVLADDAALIRQAIAELLERAGIQVVAQAGDGPALELEIPATPDTHRRVLAVVTFLDRRSL